MLTLDKVQLLEERIKKAVTLIHKLRDENAFLRDELEMLKTHNEELKDYAKSIEQSCQQEKSVSSEAIDFDLEEEQFDTDLRPAAADAELLETDQPLPQGGRGAEELPLSQDDLDDDILIDLDPDEDIPLY
jgi:predicted RNase H-like nuclease (RuvC/YqgF family)